MAKNISTHSKRISKVKTKRKGIHAKSKESKIKISKNYKKPYRSQGK